MTKFNSKTLTTVQPDDLVSRAENAMEKAIHVLRDKDLVVGFAESCTGGLLSSLMTRQAGVSDIFWGSVVSYSNESKNLFLNVDNAVFQRFGAVSEQCAAQMSERLFKQIEKTNKNMVVVSTKNIVTASVTGIAGPTGGSESKPVGTVFVSVSGTKIATQVFHHEFVSSTDKKILTREQIQYAAAVTALEHVIRLVEKS